MVLVQVEQGTLEGQKVKTVTGDSSFYSFKGIPYAAPPVGKLRFKEPQPPLSWEGVRKATEHSPKCPQFDVVFKKIIPGDEDCLYLNVYSPVIKPTSLLPVMFFVHGGGLKCGSGDDDAYGPDFLTTQGVVLVTINYRLEVLGFLCLDTKEVPGNAGLKDQVAALRWVNDNISKFGGDPKNITIFGESAGGSSVALHVLSPSTKGLFQRAIVMSGSPFCEWSIPFESTKRAFTLGKQLGMETEDPDKLLEFLQNVPAEKLVNTNPCVLTCEEVIVSPLKLYHFTWAVEKDLGQKAYLPSSPLELLKSGHAHDVEVIIGYTKEECVMALVFKSEIEKYLRYDEMYVPRDILYNTAPPKILEAAKMIQQHFFKPNIPKKDQVKELIKYWSESAFEYSIQKYLTLLSETEKCKIYFYRFSMISERNAFGNIGKEFDISAPGHLDDLQYIFHAKALDLPVDKNSRSYKMVQQFCTLFTNFAKYGNPTPDSSLGAIWKAYDNTNQPFLDIDEQFTLGSHLNDDMVKFWDGIYKFVGLPY